MHCGTDGLSHMMYLVANISLSCR